MAAHRTQRGTSHPSTSRSRDYHNSAPRYRFGQLTHERRGQLYRLLEADGGGGEIILLMCVEFYGIPVATTAMMLGMSVPRAVEMLDSARKRAGMPPSSREKMHRVY